KRVRPELVAEANHHDVRPLDQGARADGVDPGALAVPPEWVALAAQDRRAAIVARLVVGDRAEEFDRQAAHYILVSRRAIDRNVETVLSSAALFAKPGGEADRWEFFEFAEKNLPQHPGIQAIAWVPRVLAAERTDYVRRARDDGLYGFDITEQGADGSPVRASQRSEYFPIYYVEPFKGNEGLLGADLSVQGAYMEAFERARDTGETVAAYGAQPSVASAPPMTLLLISPVYRPGTQPNTQAARRQTLAGNAVGLFRIRFLDISRTGTI
ncbi:hypothetical protein LCGC14_3096470, partial [marine sediment metagenome]